MQPHASPPPGEGTERGLAPQPDRPDQFPIRVPVVVDGGGAMLRAEVIASTPGVLLLQSTERNTPLPPLGTPIRVRSEWDRQQINGRMAAHGVAGRFLVSLGERAIRRAKRFNVELTGVARSAQLRVPLEVRIVDLSTGGARVEGVQLPVGTEVALLFTPPGRSAPIDVLGFVVRVIEDAETPSVGVAFRLVQAAMDVLGSGSLAS